MAYIRNLGDGEFIDGLGRVQTFLESTWREYFLFSEWAGRTKVLSDKRASDKAIQTTITSLTSCPKFPSYLHIFLACLSCALNCDGIRKASPHDLHTVHAQSHLCNVPVTYYGLEKRVHETAKWERVTSPRDLHSG